VLAFWRRHFLGTELGLAAALTLAFALWVGAFHGEAAVQSVLAGQRAALYGTLAAIDGALLGFVIATTAIVLGFAQDDRFEVLRASAHYPTLWRTFISTIKFLGLATLAALVALLVDHDNDPVWPAMVACGGTTLIAGLRLGRSVWILEHVIRIVTRPSPQGPTGSLDGPAADARGGRRP